MKARIEPGKITGNVQPPPSKSMTQRVYAAALLHTGKTIVANAGRSDDEQAALGIIQSLGAHMSYSDDRIIITSEGINSGNTADSIDCGESGLSARLFIPIAALSGKTITINGKGSLLSRPMTGVEEALQQMDVQVVATNGCLPITLSGKLLPQDIDIDGSHGSQLLSGLLFAYCYAQRDFTPVITVKHLKSKPYVDMTIHVLNMFGKEVQNIGHSTFKISEDHQGISGKEIVVTIEGDWSSAANFLVAGAIAGEVTITGVKNNGLQADNAILPLLIKAGADIIINEDAITVKRSRLTAFEFDATDCPDLFPILAILAACCEGESYITGVHRLFNKESNRAQSISEMLMDFDVPCSIEDDVLCVTGVGRLQGTIIDAHNDHRIVMAAAIGALRANGPVDILHAEAVNKSYPDFFKHIALCGVTCSFDQ